MNPFQRAILSPRIDVPPDGAFRRKVVGQIPPLAACAENGKDRFNDFTQVGFAGSSTRRLRPMRLNPRPLVVGDVARILESAPARFQTKRRLVLVCGAK